MLVHIPLHNGYEVIHALQSAKPEEKNDQANAVRIAARTVSVRTLLVQETLLPHILQSDLGSRIIDSLREVRAFFVTALQALQEESLDDPRYAENVEGYLSQFDSMLTKAGLFEDVTSDLEPAGLQ